MGALKKSSVGWLLVIGVVATTLGCPFASASAAASKSKLSLSDTTGKARVISLAPLPEAGRYRGSLTLYLTNRRGTPARIFIAYYRAGGGRYDALSSTAAAVVRSAQPVSKRGLVAPPRRPRPVQLSFSLPRGKPASWLDGSLAITAKPTKGNAGPQRLLVPVKGEFRPLAGVSFEPAEVTLQVTAGELKGGSQIRLYGPGADALLGRKPPLTETVLLGNDEGNRVAVTLEDLHPGRGGDVVGTLTVDDPPPGGYEGSLTLGAGEGGPSLGLTVNSRYALICAIALVLLGAVIGGLLPVLSSNMRERARLRTRLKSAIERFQQKYDSDRNSPKLLWDMSLTMGPRPWLGGRWSAVSEADRIAGLYAELGLIRNDDDIDELEPKVNEATASIARWLLLFEPAARLRDLFDRSGVPDRIMERWEETALVKDTERLLQSLKHKPPEDMKAALALARRAIEQYVWHRLVLEAWIKIARAERSESIDEETRVRLSHIDLKSVLDPEPAASERTPDEMTELAVVLGATMRQARRVLPTLDRYGDAPTAETKENYIAAVELAEGESPRALRRLEEEADRFDDRVRDEAIVESPGATAQLGQQLRMLDWITTAVLAVAAAFLYTVPLWGSTWGTEADLLAAAAAGLGTEVVVQWGAMPIMRSLRRRKSASAPATSG